jgi:hypothetical protein
MEVVGQFHAPAALSVMEKTPRPHWMWGWVGPRAGLDVMEKRGISCHCQESNPDCPARIPSLYRLSCIVWLLYPVGTSWGWVVSFTSLPLYSRGDRSWFYFSRRLNGPQSRLDIMEKRKVSCPYQESNTVLFSRPASSVGALPTKPNCKFLKHLK